MTAQWFGDYEIIKRLRVGGMATLYLARRHGAAGFSRLVALKMIHPHLVAQPNFIEMFVDEARICSQISHPNVVHVEEFGVLDDVHYLVMEYLDGCSVSELLRVFFLERRTLDPELAARVILQVAGGLHVAHETCGTDGQPLELIHRDISPSNVLISVDGNAKLIDFGIAKARNRLSETQAGITLKGKYRYVAPEQAQHVVVDRRCDIFSLGIVFWELLVGRQLFPDDSHIGLLERLYQTDVPAPSTANPAVPEVFDPIVLAMLQHDPADRPQTAAEVQRRIASAIPGAANRDASELGALAVEVRDRCAERRARSPSSQSSGSDSNRSFSPSRSSSSRPRTSTGFQIPVDPTGGSGVLVTPASAPEPEPEPVLEPVPPRWWTRRGLQIGAGLVGAGVILIVLLGHQGTATDANASAAPRPSRELELVVPHDPVALHPTMPSPPTVVRSAPVAPPAGAPPAAAPPPAPAPAPPPSSAAPAPSGAPASVPAAPPAQVGGPAASPPAPAPRHEVARITARPRPKPPRPVASEPVAPSPAPAPHAPKSAGASPPFTSESFDDAANTSGAPAAPEAAKDKKTPSVSGFDN